MKTEKKDYVKKIVVYARRLVIKTCTNTNFREKTFHGSLPITKPQISSPSKIPATCACGIP